MIDFAACGVVGCQHTRLWRRPMVASKRRVLLRRCSACGGDSIGGGRLVSPMHGFPIRFGPRRRGWVAGTGFLLNHRHAWGRTTRRSRSAPPPLNPLPAAPDRIKPRPPLHRRGLPSGCGQVWLLGRFGILSWRRACNRMETFRRGVPVRWRAVARRRRAASKRTKASVCRQRTLASPGVRPAWPLFVSSQGLGELLVPTQSPPRPFRA